MFIISLTYVADLAQVDEHIDAHIDYLQAHYDTGTFLVSGRKEPRTGGVILARSGSLSDLTAIVESDPFVQHGVADYEIIEFQATMTSKELAFLQETPTA